MPFHPTYSILAIPVRFAPQSAGLVRATTNLCAVTKMDLRFVTVERSNSKPAVITPDVEGLKERFNALTTQPIKEERKLSQLKELVSFGL
jgi:hypothetical protein